MPRDRVFAKGKKASARSRAPQGARPSQHAHGRRAKRYSNLTERDAVDIPGFWEFCKANSSSGVLLIALAGFARIAIPRIDKLIDHFIAMNEKNANIKPQLDALEKVIEAVQNEQGDVCRFKDPAVAHVAGR